MTDAKKMGEEAAHRLERVSTKDLVPAWGRAPKLWAAVDESGEIFVLATDKKSCAAAAKFLTALNKKEPANG